MLSSPRGVERGQQAEHEIRAAGGKVLFVKNDVSNAEEVQVLIARIVETFEQLDCAFNNAAVLSKNGPHRRFWRSRFQC